MPNVTVYGASGTIVTVPFTGSANYALAQQLAGIINTAFNNGNLSATNAPTVPVGGITEQLTSVGGAFSPPVGTNFFTDSAAAPVTLTGAAFMNVIAGTGGLTFNGAVGNASIAAGGGNNYINMPTGSSYDIALGGGNDTVIANGSGSIDAGAGTNVISISGSAGTSNILFSDGTGDTITAGAGAATVGETGTKSTIFMGTTSGLYADGGSGDTIVGSNAYVNQTVYGNGGDVVFGGNNTLTFVGGVGGSTIVGGVKDTLFGVSGGDINYYSSTSSATLVAGAGSETLNAGGGTQGDMLIGGAGSTTMFAGTGADSLAFFNGTSGGTDLVNGFNSQDQIDLVNYGGAAPTVMAAGGSTTINLSDGTKITLSGFTSSNTSYIKSFG
ncbi:beta strand repeat-containing protein [Acidisphaera rubrifaciens]|uniref:Uncharacterized protein n=1 Tax=Acidisphaera rubrifaciens HS-AP3 TaxID=1231350 RepID=A0A0D6P8F9_9PROT|nr:calcium-binding protein [Acidisphaera rubrifaciens]GAN77503.1 hypothetical protein Asru_0347_02 [Acidisphaera rubrifaciens HS-AP3]